MLWHAMPTAMLILKLILYSTNWQIVSALALA